MNRYRLVTRTTNARGTERHVSSIVQTLDEAIEDMETEGAIARAAGWDVTLCETDNDPFPWLVCTRKRTLRSISIRQSTPMDDAV